MRVWLLEMTQRRVNLEAAERYGKVHYVFGRGERRPGIFDVVLFARCVVRTLEARGFDDEDALCVAGPTVPNMIAALAIFKRWGRCVMLLHDATQDTYVLRDFTGDGIHARDDKSQAEAGGR